MLYAKIKKSAVSVKNRKVMAAVEKNRKIMKLAADVSDAIESEVEDILADLEEVVKEAIPNASQWHDAFDALSDELSKEGVDAEFYPFGEKDEHKDEILEKTKDEEMLSEDDIVDILNDAIDATVDEIEDVLQDADTTMDDEVIKVTPEDAADDSDKPDEKPAEETASADVDDGDDTDDVDMTAAYANCVKAVVANKMHGKGLRVRFSKVNPKNSKKVTSKKK